MDTATTEIYTYGHTLSLHDALPIWLAALPQVATALGTSKAELVGEAEQAALQAAIVEKQTVAGAAVTQEMLAAIAATPVETSAFATLDRSADERLRSEEHTSELQSLMRISYAVFCLKKKNNTTSERTEA